MALPITFWTDETRVEQLKLLHAQGDSFTDIGAKLGCSRNSAIGKAHRLGLTEPKVKRAKHVPQRKPIVRIVRMNGNSDKMRVMQSVTGDLFRPRVVDLPPHNLTFMELGPHDCRYIAGDDFLFCGHLQMAGSSYCLKHHTLCYRKPEPPKPQYMREAA